MSEIEDTYKSIIEKIQIAGSSLTNEEILNIVMFGFSSESEVRSTEAKYKIAKNIRSNIQSNLIDVLNRTFQKTNSITENDINAFSDPFGILENREKSKKDLDDKWKELKEKLEDVDIDINSIQNDVVKKANQSTNNTVDAVKSILDPELNSNFKVLISKLDKLSNKTEDRFILDESKIEQIKKKSGLDENIINNFFEKALDIKKQESPLSQKLYETGPKKFSLDEKSIKSIVDGLNLNNSEKDKLLSSLVEETKNQKEELGSIKKFLTDRSSGIISVLTDLFGLLATGIVALIFGKPILQLVDKMFGTNLEAAFDSVTNNLKKFSGYIIDGGKLMLYAISVLISSLNLFKNAILNIPKIIDAAKVTGTGIVARAKAVGTGIVTGTKAVGTGIGNLLKISKTSSNVVSTAAKAAPLVQSVFPFAAEEAGKAAGKAATNVGGKIASKAGLGILLKTGLGALFKRIPIIGGLVDLAVAISDFSKGDYTGGVLRTIGALGNFFSLVPGFGLIGFGISLLADLLDDMLTEKAGGDASKKSFSQIPDIFGTIIKIIADWATGLIKRVSNWFTSWWNNKKDNIPELPKEEIQKTEIVKTETPKTEIAKSEKTQENKESKIEKKYEVPKNQEEDYYQSLLGEDFFNQVKISTGLDLKDSKNINELINNSLGLGNLSQSPINIKDLAKSEISMPNSLEIGKKSIEHLSGTISNVMEGMASMTSNSINVMNSIGSSSSRDEIDISRSKWFSIRERPIHVY